MTTKTVTITMTQEQADELRQALGHIRMADVFTPRQAQMVHFTYWKLRQAHEGKSGEFVKLDIAGATIDITLWRDL